MTAENEALRANVTPSPVAAALDPSRSSPSAPGQSGARTGIVSEETVDAALAAIPAHQKEAREAVWAMPSRAQVRAMLEAAAPRVVAEWEQANAATWGTSCTSCARVLDSAYAETVRREQAEATLARITARVRHRLETAIVQGPVSEVCRDVLDIIEAAKGDIP